MYTHKYVNISVCTYTYIKIHVSPFHCIPVGNLARSSEGVRARTYFSLFICACSYTYISYGCIYIHTCIQVYIYTYIHPYMDVHICIYLYTYLTISVYTCWESCSFWWVPSTCIISANSSHLLQHLFVYTKRCTYVYTNICIYIYIHVNIYICICLLIYMYMCIYV